MIAIVFPIIGNNSKDLIITPIKNIKIKGTKKYTEENFFCIFFMKLEKNCSDKKENMNF